MQSDEGEAFSMRTFVPVDVLNSLCKSVGYWNNPAANILNQHENATEAAQQLWFRSSNQSCQTAAPMSPHGSPLYGKKKTTFPSSNSSHGEG